MYNFSLQKLEIYKFGWWLNYWSWNFTSIEDRKCNPMINLSKFTSNKKILSGVIVLVYNKVCYQILSKV